MLQAMYNGVSAIQATQQDMDVIGNDIANVDTTAYKGSEVTFADQLSQLLAGASAPTGSSGGTDPMQTGTGVSVGSITPIDSQGSLLSTSSPTDMAIQGNGYFMVSSPSSGVAYTRDGHFALNSDGDLVDASTGAYVLGWTASSTGSINTSAQVTQASTIQIPTGVTSPASATANMTVTGDLTPSASSTDSVTTSATLYDSLGNTHTVAITFSPDTTAGAAANTWNWSATLDGTALTAGKTGGDQTNGGTITFNSDGDPVIPSGSSFSLSFTPGTGQSTPQTVNLNMTGLADSLTSASQGTSGTITATADGYEGGTLDSFSIDENGVISGTFSNGQSMDVGQVAMANFANPQGLVDGADNTVTSSSNSGAPAVGAADTDGLGSVAQGYLEQSNVDLGSEMSNMIVVQNAFEANTKIVTAVDQMLSTLIQMKQ